MIVLASHPQCCVVCHGDRTVRDTQGTSSPCPHCVRGIPVLHLPIRQDIPRGGTA